MASAPSDANLLLWEQLDADTTHRNRDVLEACDVIFLAVKPNLFDRVARDLRGPVDDAPPAAAANAADPSYEDLHGLPRERAVR